MAKTFLKIAATSATTFFRAGRAWPKEGAIVPVTDLTEADIAWIRAEPMLRVEEVDPTEAAAPAEDAIKAALRDVIAALPAEGFGQDGKPKLDAIRKELPDLKISAELRDAVWAELKPPASPAS